MIYLVVKESADYEGQDTENLIELVLTDIKDERLTKLMKKYIHNFDWSYSILAYDGKNINAFYTNEKDFIKYDKTFYTDENEYNDYLEFVKEHDRLLQEYKDNEKKEKEQDKLNRDKMEYERLKELFEGEEE